MHTTQMTDYDDYFPFKSTLQGTAARKDSIMQFWGEVAGAGRDMIQSGAEDSPTFALIAEEFQGQFGQIQERMSKVNTMFNIQ